MEPPAVILHLLDSVQGHPLQTWTFVGREMITIGRAADNDVIIADPYVSRSHAYLQAEEAAWRLISISRQQVLFEGHICGELPVSDGVVFRLGPYGCSLQFCVSHSKPNNNGTICFEPTLMPVFNLDREKMQTEVNAIAGGSNFEQLKIAAKKLREQRQIEETRG